MANDNVNEKLTALADEIREISGTTDKLGIDEMTSTLNAENTNFNTNLTAQDNLIEQIKSALQGKAVSGGAGGEDVTAETNAYTEKITQLTTAVTALEEELANKAGTGSSTKMFYKTFIGDSSASPNITIQHNLGAIPTKYIIQLETVSEILTADENTYYITMIAGANDSLQLGFGVFGGPGLLNASILDMKTALGVSSLEWSELLSSIIYITENTIEFIGLAEFLGELFEQISFSDGLTYSIFIMAEE